MNISNLSEFLSVVRFLQDRGSLCHGCGLRVAKRHNARYVMCVSCADKAGSQEWHEQRNSQLELQLDDSLVEYSRP